MNKLIVLAFLFFCLGAVAQAPEKISYQAIVRASDNSLVADSPVSLRLIIRQGNVNGATAYEETHSAKTNANGLVSIEIGSGDRTNGAFNQIKWENGPFFIETQVDPNGGTNYSIIGVSQLLSVPYALYAKYAENVTGSAPNTTSEPKIATIIDFITSRPIEEQDINNTIACTKSGVLTLPLNFSKMQVGETLNLEAHNGAVLTIQADPGVHINYTDGGKATFESESGNVRFGLLRKSKANSYIISGQ